MKDLIRKTAFTLSGITTIGIIFGFAYKAYFTAYYVPDGTMLDGLGRITFISPWPMQLLHIPLWPGPQWFLSDLAIFIFGNYLGFKLIKYSAIRKLPEKTIPLRRRT